MYPLFFIFPPNDSHSNLWMFFISSKKYFSVSRYSIFLYFLHVGNCYIAKWLKINLKVYGIINCLNKNLITHFVWYLEKRKRYDIENFYIDRVLNKEHFYGKIIQKISTKNYFQTFFLVKNPKCLKKLYGSFLWMGFNCLMATHTIRRHYFLSLSPRIPGTQLIDLGTFDWESSVITTRPLNSHCMQEIILNIRYF